MIEVYFLPLPIIHEAIEKSKLKKFSLVILLAKIILLNNNNNLYLTFQTLLMENTRTVLKIF